MKKPFKPGHQLRLRRGIAGLGLATGLMLLAGPAWADFMQKCDPFSVSTPSGGAIWELSDKPLGSVLGQQSITIHAFCTRLYDVSQFSTRGYITANYQPDTFQASKTDTPGIGYRILWAGTPLAGPGYQFISWYMGGGVGHTVTVDSSLVIEYVKIAEPDTMFIAKPVSTPALPIKIYTNYVGTGVDGAPSALGPFHIVVSNHLQCTSMSYPSSVQVPDATTTQVNSTRAASRPFRIGLMQCPNGMQHARVRFEDGASPDASMGLLSNKASGSASDVNIQLLNQDSTPIRLGDFGAPVAIQGNSGTLNYQARLFSPGKHATAGPVSSTVTFTVEYD
jgi:type 1 fimbria pilin